jgi:hypothetical protein
MTDWYAPNQQAVGTEPAAGAPAKSSKAKDEPAEPAKATKAKGKDDKD